MRAQVPTRVEINTIVNQATDQLLRTMAHVTWVPLPDEANSLGLPDTDGFVCVGWLVASGEHTIQDWEVWWHPERHEGRLRRIRAG